MAETASWARQIPSPPVPAPLGACSRLFPACRPFLDQTPVIDPRYLHHSPLRKSIAHTIPGINDSLLRYITTVVPLTQILQRHSKSLNICNSVLWTLHPRSRPSNDRETRPHNEANHLISRKQFPLRVDLESNDCANQSVKGNDIRLMIPRIEPARGLHEHPTHTPSQICRGSGAISPHSTFASYGSAKGCTFSTKRLVERL